MNVYLFGASTTTGRYFYDLLSSCYPAFNIRCFSRNNSLLDAHNYSYVDLTQPSSFLYSLQDNGPQIWINFAPIWDFVYFLSYLHENHLDRLLNLKGLIICSSSSSQTKRFAISEFDKSLSQKLRSSEVLASDISLSLGINISILCPSMIYGSYDSCKDKNISLIIKFLSILPFLIFPCSSGLRQPIHASQLASVALEYFHSFIASSHPVNTTLFVGGDETISYSNMIRRICDCLPSHHSASNTPIFTIPNRLFFFILSPLFLISPKKYESVLRIASNLSGFSSSCSITKCPPQPFPVMPL